MADACSRRKENNEKPEMENRKWETGQWRGGALSGFEFPVSHFPFDILSSRSEATPVETMPGFWSTIFGNDHPVEVEIGPGTGTFILAVARRHPHINFFGIEHAHGRAGRLQAVIAAQRLFNARVLGADAGCVVSRVIPAESVHAYHVYFPDPWWKRRHHRRRLFTAQFAAALGRTLVAGGRLYVATDVDETYALMLQALAACAVFAADVQARPIRESTTTFERKGLARGATIKEAVFVKRGAASGLPSHSSNAAPMTPAESPS
jgi:tRNA (guanine-N7-)-methyltransferase